MKKIIYMQPNGISAVVSPAEGARLAISVTVGDKTMRPDSPIPADQFMRGWPVAGAVVEWAETEDEFLNRIAAKDVPNGTLYEIVESENIPTDRTFRDAWKSGNGRVEHDIEKCKLIAHEKRRIARATEFAPLDIEATIPAKAADAETKRQVIREKYDAIQSAIDAATDVAEIKAAILN